MTAEKRVDVDELTDIDEALLNFVSRRLNDATNFCIKRFTHTTQNQFFNAIAEIKVEKNPSLH